jgi:hypothetical protein
LEGEERDMDVLFGGWVASQEYKSWEHRMSKVVIRRPEKSEMDLFQPLQSLAATLRRFFAVPKETTRACELNPEAC